MKQLLLPLLGSLLLIALTGCDTMAFSRYTGDQRAWPTGSAFTDGVFDVPVYRGWPEKPYEVVGCIQFTNPNIDWNRGDVQQAARQAKEVGADALIVMPKGADPSPTAATARQQMGIDGAHTVAVVIKWK